MATLDPFSMLIGGLVAWIIALVVLLIVINTLQRKS